MVPTIHKDTEVVRPSLGAHKRRRRCPAMDGFPCHLVAVVDLRFDVNYGTNSTNFTAFFFSIFLTRCRCCRRRRRCCYCPTTSNGTGGPDAMCCCFTSSIADSAILLLLPARVAVLCGIYHQRHHTLPPAQIGA